MRVLILALVVLCAHATPEHTKNVGGVKGGYSGRGHQYGENLVSNYYNNSTQHQGYGIYGGNGAYGVRNNLSEPVRYEVGVCYIEVPTASLAKDPAHVPVGNGSRSDLSRIHSCCSGYIRNLYNYKICDPVCDHECINGLCSAPNTCVCFPDHVKNLAGICVPTCPIGCQNGQCSGGECICKDGYRLDSESKFCVPYCREQCGGPGRGNCTAPNTCECKNGLKPTPEGSCKLSCSRCKDGECVGPNECRCNYGFAKNQYGDCVAQCSIPCTPPNRCVAPNICDNPANPKYPSTTTTVSPYGQYPYNQHVPGVPYGQQPQYPNYPGSQPSHYPGQQNYSGQPQPYYPGQPQPNFPANQQSYYPGSYPGGPQSNHSGSPQYYYPGYPNPNTPGSQNQYPGYQPTNNTGYPQNNQPGAPLSNYPANQYNSTYPHPSDSSQRPPYNPYLQSTQKPPYNPYLQSTQKPPYNPYLQSTQKPPYNPYLQSTQRPQYSPDGQLIYTNISGNQPSLYPDSQHLGPGQGNLSPNSSQPGGAYYPNSQYYPGNQYYPDQRPNPNSGYQPINRPTNAEPFYPNSQLYPGQQTHPNQQNQGQYPSHSPGSEYQHIYPDIQMSAVELLCSIPCVNGTCVGRDMCTCNTGYVPIAGDTTRCQPYCTGCGINGECVSPYVCLCNPGYVKDFSVKGKSSCVRRIRRSVDASAPVDVADKLVFEIPDEYID